jgi:hypothetical protein
MSAEVTYDGAPKEEEIVLDDYEQEILTRALDRIEEGLDTCFALAPMMEPWKHLLKKYDERFRCIRKPRHTGMHQWKNDKGQRTEWTGGKR